MTSNQETAAGAQYSKTDTGSKPADPYKAKAYENELPVKEKVEGLIKLIEGSMFGMMTTRQAKTGHLVSRCMALAGKVRCSPLARSSDKRGSWIDFPFSVQRI